mmetsp:Transcript_60854/g.137605  ORF Transcript_60854/g.137605 Transcript_60854/m.137605 type:complete len:289 (+) Transcript_60854:375-1241(+)
MAFFPVFKMQDSLMANTLGSDRWFKMRDEYDAREMRRAQERDVRLKFVPPKPFVERLARLGAMKQVVDEGGLRALRRLSFDGVRPSGGSRSTNHSSHSSGHSSGGSDTDRSDGSDGSGSARSSRDSARRPPLVESLGPGDPARRAPSDPARDPARDLGAVVRFDGGETDPGADGGADGGTGGATGGEVAGEAGSLGGEEEQLPSSEAEAPGQAPGQGRGQGPGQGRGQSADGEGKEVEGPPPKAKKTSFMGSLFSSTAKGGAKGGDGKPSSKFASAVDPDFAKNPKGK